MSKPLEKSQHAAQAGTPKPAAAATGNPALRMLGLPRLRARLPSRNWTIFLTVVGSFSGAVIYDRRHRRKAQQHWCTAVSHLSREPLGPDQLPRKLTVYLSAPPGDGLRPSREFFVEYVKPVLVAAAVDWEVVEGRKEGDVRAALAKRIREARLDSREKGDAPVDEGNEDPIKDMRKRLGIRPADERGGDLVLGRHTWKEYMRGLHEGWLGPLDEPAALQHSSQANPTTESKYGDPSLEQTRAISPSINGHPEDSSTTSAQTSGNDSFFDVSSPEPAPSTSASSDVSSTAPANSETESPETKPETKAESKPSPLPPYISPASYPDAALAPSTPSHFAVSTAVGLPHLLGFFNTPIRIYRFLTRRHLAETTGQQVATLLLASDARSYRSPLGGELGSFASDDSQAELSGTDRDESSATMWEARSMLLHEERDWHKSAREPNKAGDESKERPWLEPVALDLRIAERMRAPDSDTVALPHRDVTFEGREDGMGEQAGGLPGNYREWKGSADPVLKKVSWGQWLKEASGFNDEREPRGLGAKDGLVDGDS